MSRVNLLPPEYRKERARRALSRRLRVVGLLAALLSGGLYGVRTLEVMGLRSDLGDLQAQTQSVQGQIDSLGDVAAQRDAVTYGRSVTTALLAGRISWSSQFLRLASTVPNGFTLSSLSGQTIVGSGTAIVGTLTFSATSRGLQPTEQWLLALDDEPGWVNGWIGTLTATPDGGFTVSGTVDLTAEALAPTGSGV